MLRMLDSPCRKWPLIPPPPSPTHSSPTLLHLLLLRPVQTVAKQVMQKREVCPVVCWGALRLDADTLDTKSEVLPTFMPPTNPAGFHKAQNQAPTSERTEAGEDGRSGISSKTEAIIGVDVSLTRQLN